MLHFFFLNLTTHIRFAFIQAAIVGDTLMMPTLHVAKHGIVTTMNLSGAGTKRILIQPKSTVVARKSAIKRCGIMVHKRGVAVTTRRTRSCSWINRRRCLGVLRRRSGSGRLFSSQSKKTLLLLDVDKVFTLLII